MPDRSMRYFCTYFDRNYFAKGLTLIRSLCRHEGRNFRLFVVCMDELTRLLLEKLAIEQLVLVPMHEVERGDEALLACRAKRTVVEYLWTTTATTILRIIERHPEIDVLTYLDADLFFFQNCDAIYQELGSRSILIHEHRFSPEHRASAKYGIFNVGLLCFRRDEKGLEALSWWRNRCIEWCYARYEDGLYGDQAYLNDWPARYEGHIVVTRNIGVGVAPWNHSQYSYRAAENGDVLVNGVPLVMYHFHSFVIMDPQIVIPVSDAGYRFPVDVARLCFVPYLKDLEESIRMVRNLLPEFGSGISRNGFETTEGHSLMVRDFVSGEVEKLGLPQRLEFREGGWNFFAGRQTC